MELVMEIIRIILPIAILGAIVVFVIKRLKHKYNNGTLGKKKSTGAQRLLDSLIPLGTLFGCTIGVILGMYFPFSSLYTVSLGSGAGYLCGYFAYEMYSKMEENPS